MKNVAWMGCVGLMIGGCGKAVPPEAKAVIDAHHADALKVAEEAIKVCPSMKGRTPITATTPPMPASPAIGTGLEGDPKVYDVFVMCSWPAAGNSAMSEGSGLKSLRGKSEVPARPVTMPEDKASTTCKKDARDCEEVIVPSRYSSNAGTADLRIVKPTADGGTVEVTIVVIP